ASHTREALDQSQRCALNAPAMSPRRFVLPAFAFALLLPAACGSRGPLDLDVGPGAYGNGADSGAPVDSSAGGATGEDAAASDGGAKDAKSDAPFDSGNPLINCGQCLSQTCGQQILGCVIDTGCRTALQCVVQMCLAGGGGGGGVDPQCLAKCSGSDPAAI